MNQEIKTKFFEMKSRVVSHREFERLCENWQPYELFGSYASCYEIVEKHWGKQLKRVNLTTSVRGYYTQYLLVKRGK